MSPRSFPITIIEFKLQQAEVYHVGFDNFRKYKGNDIDWIKSNGYHFSFEVNVFNFPALVLAILLTLIIFNLEISNLLLKSSIIFSSVSFVNLSLGIINNSSSPFFSELPGIR